MSFMHMDATSAASAVGFTVSLTGDSASGADQFLAEAGWQFRIDGTVFRKTNVALTQIDSTTDWISPKNNLTPADYEVRMNFTGGITLDASSAAANTWLGLGTQREFLWSCARFCSQTGTVTFDIRHATDSTKNTTISFFDGAAVAASNGSYVVGLEAN